MKEYTGQAANRLDAVVCCTWYRWRLCASKVIFLSTLTGSSDEPWTFSTHGQAEEPQLTYEPSSPCRRTDHTCLYSHTRNIYSEVDRTNHLIYSFLFRVSFYFPTRDCNWFQSDAGSHGGDVGMGACSRWWRFLYRDNERNSLEKGKVKIFRQKNNCCNSGAAGFLEVSLCSERIQIPGVRRKRKCRERMRD